MRNKKKCEAIYKHFAQPHNTFNFVDRESFGVKKEE